MDEDFEVDVGVLGVGEDEGRNDFGDGMMSVLLRAGRTSFQSIVYQRQHADRLTDTSSIYTTVENSSQVMLSKSNDPGVSHSSNGKIELRP